MRAAAFVSIALLLNVLSGVAAAAPVSTTPEEMERSLGELWKARDFAAIDEFYRAVLTEHGRFEPDGSWKIRIFHYFNSACAGEPKCSELVEQWIAKEPSCVECRFVRSSLFYIRAWQVRGGGFVGGKGESTLEQYHRLLKAAWEELQLLEKVARRDPEFHYKRLRAAYELGAPRKVANQMYEEGITVEPNYPELHTTQLLHALPRWGGKLGDARKVAERAVEATRPTMGESYYALLADEAYDKEYDAIFTDHGFAWPRVKQGFEDLLKRQNTRLNTARYAKLALVAEDRETSRAQFAKLGEWDESLAAEFVQGQFSVWKTEAQNEPPKVSPLMAAIKRGDRAELDRLLNSGVSVNVPYSQDDPFRDALGQALEYHPELFHYLVSRGADIKLCRSNCLKEAVGLGDASIVKVLLADNPKGGILQGVMQIAAAQNFSEIVSLLLQAEGNPNSGDGSKLVTPLMVAARVNALESAEVILQSTRTRIQTVDADGHSALHYAAGAGHIPMIQLLLKHQADPLFLAQGKTAGQIARERGYNAAADLLDVKVKEADGGTPLMTAVKKGDRAAIERLLQSISLNVNEMKSDASALSVAVRYHPEFVDMLMAKNANSAFGRIDGKDMLLYAVQTGDSALIRKLAKKRLNVGMGTPSPLSEAIKANSPELIRALFANPMCDPNSMTGDPSLIYALKIDALAAAKELLTLPRINVNARGYNVNDRRFETPLSVAQAKGHTELVELLKARGAKE